MIGAAVKQATGVRWVADLRDSVAANPDRRVDRLAVRMKEKAQGIVAGLLPARGRRGHGLGRDLAGDARPRRRACRDDLNGCDFDDFEGLEYHPGERFRITHTGTFFGHRDPQPFLSALAATEGDVVARFVGGLRSRTVSSPRSSGSATASRRSRTFRGVPRSNCSATPRHCFCSCLKQAAGDGRCLPEDLRVPRGGASDPRCGAAGWGRGRARAQSRRGVVVAPDDVAALTAAIEGLRARWKRGALENGSLSEELKERLSRRTRSREFAELLRELP